MQYTAVAPDEFAALSGLEDWRCVLGVIRAGFCAGSFPKAAELVTSIAEAAEAAGHHPDIDVRYPDLVRVTLTTHATGGLTTARHRPGPTDLSRRRSIGRGRRAGRSNDRVCHRHDGRRSDPPVLEGRTGLQGPGRVAGGPRPAGPAALVPADGRAADRAQPVPCRRLTSPRSGVSPCRRSD